MRRTYTPHQKRDALYLVREVGVTEASKRLGISKYTLSDWLAETRACAYSSFVGRGRGISAEERERLLEQLIHEQELDLCAVEYRRRHVRGARGSTPLALEPLEVLLDRTGVTQPHLLEWLDPTFDDVAERLAA